MPDLRQENGVNDVNDAVRRIEIGSRHVRRAAHGVGQHDLVAHHRRGQLAALDGGDDSLAAAGRDRGEDGAEYTSSTIWVGPT